MDYDSDDDAERQFSYHSEYEQSDFYSEKEYLNDNFTYEEEADSVYGDEVDNEAQNQVRCWQDENLFEESREFNDNFEYDNLICPMMMSTAITITYYLNITANIYMSNTTKPRKASAMKTSTVTVFFNIKKNFVKTMVFFNTQKRFVHTIVFFNTQKKSVNITIFFNTRQRILVHDRYNSTMNTIVTPILTKIFIRQNFNS